jgi:class 3 adenylate cyclase/tetratricopeptide (TPR) repeat protein
MLTPVECRSCGALIAEGSRFCPSCGQPLQRRSDERRIVSVLFADLVGYTSLSETRDPEQVKLLVDRCFERLVEDIVSFGGQVDKIIGDAIVALFGAPVAHEDDAERAVRAALRMEETLAAYAREWADGALRMRIGVNTGEVLVGALRAGGDYTAMGDVVNTAARLQTAAAPGEVLVGFTTWAATRAAIRYHARGPLAVKGRDEPVEMFAAVEAVLPPGHRSRRPDVPMVGRDAEVALFRNTMNSVVRHERALFGLLLGEAGVGKTRLAAELDKWFSKHHGALILQGRCVPYGEANVWWPVAEALRAGCRVEPNTALPEARELTLARVAAVFDLPASAGEVERTANGLLYLMGYEVQLKGIDPTKARDEAVRSLVAFIEASAAITPIVIQLSDLHWADDVVLELIDTLLERLARSRFVLLATARPQLAERWSPRSGRHNVVVEHLEPLDAGAATELLDLLLGGATAEVRDLLLERGGGNPFFLEELVSLLDTQSMVSATAGAAGLPDTLRGLVSARLDSLPSAERAVLQDASVFGREGIVTGLEVMADGLGRRIDVRSALSALRAKEILEVDGKTWSFRSDLVREVAYTTLTKTDRALRHVGIAKYLEEHADGDLSDDLVDRLANHYGVAASLVRDLGRVDDVPVDITDRALRWIEEAAVRAERSEVLPVAVRLYTHGLELVGTELSSRRLAFLLGRANNRAEAWDLAGARSDVETARAEAGQLGDEGGVARSLVVLGDIESKCGDGASAVAHLRDAIIRYEKLGDERGRADALRQCGMAEMFAGRYDDARRTVEMALAAFDDSEDDQGRAWALQNLAWIAFVNGRVATAEDHLQASLALFSDIGDTVGLAWAFGLLGFVRLQQGRFADARVLADQILGEARGRGDRWACGMMTVLLATLSLWEGRTEEAVDLADEAFDIFRTLGDDLGQAQALAPLGVGQVLAGRIQDGLDTFADFRATHGRLPGTRASLGGPHLGALASVGVAIGDPALVLEALDLTEPSDCVGADALALGTGEIPMLAAAAALQLGDTDVARQLVTPLVESSLGDEDDDEDDETPWPSRVGGRGRAPIATVATLPAAASVLALVEAADGNGEAVDALRRSVHQAEAATYLDRVRVDVAAGLAAARRGDEIAAGEALTSATDQIDATGDRITQAMVRMAAAAALAALGGPEADRVAAEAQARLAVLGISAEGWSTVFDSCLGLTPVSGDI